MEKNLNMPKTNFSQRSESVKREPELLKMWTNTFNQRNEQNEKQLFTLSDGPPYCSGNLHLGHSLNKVLKDVLVKYKLMSGHKVDFRPGSDCHGLPTELGVQKKFGNNLSTSELRDKCSDWAMHWHRVQKEEQLKWGLLGNYDNTYLTMNKEYESNQLEVLFDMLNKNMVYLEKRPVYYSPSTRTSLAEAELEYKDVTHLSAYFTFELENKDNLLVWTTQPWTVLGNKLVCVNKNLNYSTVRYNNKNYVVSTNCLSLLESCEVLSTYSGKELLNRKYLNKVNNTSGFVVHDDFVKDGDGTGLVHLCPSHGDVDYDVCRKYLTEDFTDLSDEKGNLLFNNLPLFEGGNDGVVSEMHKYDMLFKVEEYTHSYPHDWRTNKPVYFKLSKQFFLDLTTLKDKCLDALEDVEFSDNKYKNRLTNMLRNRPRWCLSRQRKWGFPLAVFLMEDKLFMPNDLQEHLLNLFKQYGSNAWFDMTTEELLPEKYHSLNLTKCSMTMDVWFDSGVSWKQYDNNQADVYFEGSDQCRGYFQSSLLTSVAYNGKAPYKKVYTHGFVLDQNGNKMSKSLGNVVVPDDLVKKYNTDVLRMWACSVNYHNDVVVGENVLKTCADYYFKFRNTLRYLLGNLYGYNYQEFELSDKDKTALKECDFMYNQCLKYYNECDYRNVLQTLVTWVNRFSGQYLDLETKSHLYEYSVDSRERLKCQQVLYTNLMKFLKVLAPMLSFLAEDAYQNLELKNKESVFMEEL